MWIKDPKTKEPSVTLTAFMTGYAVCLLKLIFSGVAFKAITISPFSGVEFAAAVGALGSIYVLKRRQDKKNDTSQS